MRMPFAPLVLLLGICHNAIIGQACKTVCPRVFLTDETCIETAIKD